MVKNEEFSNQEFHQFLDDALKMMPLDNFTVKMGDGQYPLRYIIIALRDQNIEWMNAVHRATQIMEQQSRRVENIHHDFTIALGLLTQVARMNHDVTAFIRDGIAEFRTAKVNV